MAKQRLTENFSTDWKEPLNIRKLSLQEGIDKKIIVEGKEHTVLEKWEIPVWRLGKKNLNGRTYRESLGKLIEKICKEVVTANLDKHPGDNDDPSVSNILSIAKNPHVRECIMYVDAYVVDEAFDKKLNKMVEAGYGMGVSSSVLGDVDDEGNVIDESVEMERFFDWVISPSYEVYATKECKIVENEETKKESIKENVTIDNIKESNIMPDKMQKLSEKTMRLNLAKIIEDADKKEIISERILALEEAATYVSEEFLPDMFKDINEKIINLKDEALTLAEKGKTVDKLAEDIQLKESEKVSLQEKISSLEKDKASLQEKYDVSCKLLDETKEYASNAVQLLESSDAEAGSKFSAREYLTIVESYEKIVEEKSIIENKLSVLQGKLESTTNFKNQFKEKIDVLEKKISEMEVIIAGYEAEPEIEPENNDEYNTDTFDYSEYGPEADDSVDLDLGNDDEVGSYYEDLYTSDNRYESIKTDILKCKTLMEAQKTALRLKVLVEGQEKSRRVKESIQEKDWTQAYDTCDVSKLKGKYI